MVARIAFVNMLRAAWRDPLWALGCAVFGPQLILALRAAAAPSCLVHLPRTRTARERIFFALARRPAACRNGQTARVCGSTKGARGWRLLARTARSSEASLARRVRDGVHSLPSGRRKPPFKPLASFLAASTAASAAAAFLAACFLALPLS